MTKRGIREVAAVLLVVVLAIGATTALAPGRATAAPAGTVTVHGRGFAHVGGITAGPDGNIWFGASGAIVRMTPAGVPTFFDVGGTPDHLEPSGDGALWFWAGGSWARIAMDGSVTRFAGLGGPSGGGLAVDDDHGAWFIDATQRQLGHVNANGGTSTHQILTFQEGYTGKALKDVTIGPDGKVWFAVTGLGVGSIDPVTGAIERVPLPFNPTSIVTGSDGALWTPHEGGIARLGASGAVTDHPLPPGDFAHAPVLGVDGALWYTNGSHGIGRMTMLGQVTSFDGPDVPQFGRVTAGPDGRMWFADTNRDRVGSITTAGHVTLAPSTQVDAPRDITLGPDGALWFANTQNNSIGRITASGAVSNHRSPNLYDVNGLTTGPDGNLWFTTCAGDNRVGRLTPEGVAVTFPTPSYPCGRSIAAGPDGNLWIAAAQQIVRVTPAGEVTSFPISGSPSKIIAGPDGKMWFAGYKVLGRITPQGVVQPLPASDVTFDIVAGPDGNVWMTRGEVKPLVRITPAGVSTAFLDVGLELGRIGVGQDGNLWIASGPSFKVVTTGGVLVGTHIDPSIQGVGGVAQGPDGALWFTNEYSSSVGRIVVRPEPAPPTAVMAIPGDGAALVSWTPGATGSVPATGYTVTASPGGATCSWTSGPRACTVTGLENGTPHTFTVTATSAAGGSAQSAPSLAVTPLAAAPGAGFHPLAPVRVLDSRTAAGGWNAPLAAGAPRPLTVAGTNGVAADATAVVLNVTATGSTANSFLTVFPGGQSPPNVSNLNFGVGQTVPNLVTVKVGADGQVAFATNNGATHVVADLVGWYGPGAGEGYSPVAPARILDSRGSTGGWGAPLGSTPKTLLVRGAGGVPASAEAVVLNVTATEGSANSFLTAFPSGQPPPIASNLNFAVGQTVPNLVSVKLGADGRVAFANNAGTVHVIADVVGYYDEASGGRFHPLDPARVFDSRAGSGKVAAGAPRTVPLVGAGGIPAGASAVVGNVTVTEGTENSFLTVYPADLPLPGTSTLNFAIGQTVPNLAVVAPGTTGRIAIANAAGATHVIVDAMGYFAAT